MSSLDEIFNQLHELSRQHGEVVREHINKLRKVAAQVDIQKVYELDLRASHARLLAALKGLGYQNSEMSEPVFCQHPSEPCFCCDNARAAIAEAEGL